MSAIFEVSHIWWHVIKQVPLEHCNSYSRSGCHTINSFFAFFFFFGQQATKQPRRLQKSLRITPHDTPGHCSQTMCSKSPQSAKNNNHTSHNTLRVQDDCSQNFARTCKSCKKKKKYINVRVSNKRGFQDAKAGLLTCETRISPSHRPSTEIQANQNARSCSATIPTRQPATRA